MIDFIVPNGMDCVKVDLLTQIKSVTYFMVDEYYDEELANQMRRERCVIE